jgi:hypothetical protein
MVDGEHLQTPWKGRLMNEYIPVPFQIPSCRVVGGRSKDKDQLTVYVPWHEIEPAVVYDLTLAVVNPAVRGAWLLENRLFYQKTRAGRVPKEEWEILKMVILPNSRQLLPKNFRNLKYTVTASFTKPKGLAKILVLLEGRAT